MFFPSPSPWNIVKDAPIIHSGEYDQLVPGLKQNTQGRYIPILPVVLITLTPDGPTWRLSPKFS